MLSSLWLEQKDQCDSIGKCLSLLLHLSLSFLNHLKRRTKRNSGNWTLLTSFLIKRALSIGHTTVYKNLFAELYNTMSGSQFRHGANLFDSVD